MEGQSESGAENGLKTLISSYSNYVWNRAATFFPSSGSNFLGKISILYPQASRKRRPCLPLPLPSHSLDCSVVMTEACRMRDVLEDIMEHIFLNLHDIQKNLQFWQSRAEGSNTQKAYFMMFERGPLAFINGTAQLLRDCIAEGLHGS